MIILDTAYVKLIHPFAKMPVCYYDSVGYDLFSCIECIIEPRSSAKIDTGLCIKPPNNTYIAIMPRSGLAFHHSVVAFSGTVDHNFEGCISILLFNHHSTDFFKIHKGMRVAQALFIPFCKPNLLQLSSFHEKSNRSTFGFGSSGMF